MAFSLLKVKSIFASKKDRLAGSGSLEPEIGFKLVHNQATNCLYVTVIGARHLPSIFGLTTAKGYVVKVKLFPGDAKFESQPQDTSWPVWNEEFKFQLNVKKAAKKPSPPSTVYPVTQLAGHFISMTIYAILESTLVEEKNAKNDEKNKNNKAADAKPGAETESTSKTDFKKFVSSFKGQAKETKTTRGIGSKRRTVGTAMWSIDPNMFQNDLKHDLKGTPDIWRPIEQLASGTTSTTNAPENKKGQVEVTLLYNTSEDGCNDTIQVNVNKMRCSIPTMQEHELKKEPLYIKSSISNKVSEAHWKSERFFPTISARWDAKTSCARLRFNSKTLHDASIYISLGCKNQMGIKEIFGKVIISEKTPHAKIFQELIASPGVPKTHWLSLE